MIFAKKYVLMLMLCLMFWLSTAVLASGWAFLAIPQSTREVAMGETGVSSSPSAAAVWWNPAHLSQGHTEAWFQGYRWLADGQGSYGGAKVNTGWGGIAAYYITHSMGGFEIRNRPGSSQGEFTLHQTVLAVGAAYQVTPELSCGLVYKTAYEDIYGDQAQDWNIFDLGLKWQNELLSLGLAVSNLKSIDPDDETYPTTYRLGVSHQRQIFGLEAVVAADAQLQKNDQGFFHFGAELGWEELIYLRAGYLQGHDSRSLAWGLGLVYRQLTTDFSLTPNDHELGNTWRMGLGFKI